MYVAVEIMSGAKRALKIFANYEDRQWIKNQRRVIDYAKGLSQLSSYLLTPKYFHSGHCLISDPIGNYFVAQEYIEGQPPDSNSLDPAAVEDFLCRLARAHLETGIVIRDWDRCHLLVETRSCIRLIDADLGTMDRLYGSTRTDYLAAEKLFREIARVRE